MKLVVMIPAFNEEQTIGSVIKEIPRKILGMNVQILVINDGSSDNTIIEAKKAGADKIVSHHGNKGLGVAFKTGLDNALAMGADIIVNTDADGQYVGAEIENLVKPIIGCEADIVLGSRFAGTIEYMPLGKRIGNRMATRMVRFLSGLPVTDGQTGFRAFTRDAALRLNVMSFYTYTQETIIQAAKRGITLVEVPCTFRRRDGHSRLISSIFGYAKKSAAILMRTYRDYMPLQFFGTIGISIFAVGTVFALYIFQYFLRTGMVSPHVPLAILTAITLIVGFQLIIFALLADMMGQQRKVSEEILYRVKKNGKV